MKLRRFLKKFHLIIFLPGLVLRWCPPQPSGMSRNAGDEVDLGKRRVAWHLPKGMRMRVHVVLFRQNELPYLIFLSSVRTSAASRVDAFSVLIQHLPSRAEAAFSARLTFGSLGGTCQIAAALFVSLSCPDALVLWWQNGTQNVQSVNWKRMRGNIVPRPYMLHSHGNTSQVIF